MSVTTDFTLKSDEPNMKVLLINPNCHKDLVVGKFAKVYQVMPPINLAYLAAVLEKAGVKVDIIDALAYNLPLKDIIKLIINKQPDLIGITCLTQTASEVFALCQEIKRYISTPPIILGNLHASYFADEILQKRTADIIVHNEGEYTLLELVKRFRDKKDLRYVKGISFLQNGKIITTSFRPFIKDLDELPFPGWHLFPLNKYRLFSFSEIRRPGMLILGSRGCPYNCAFCSLKTMGNQRRKRSAQNIAEEIECLIENFGYKQVSFIDSIFPFDKPEGIEFAEELKRRRLPEKIVWTTETRVDLVDEELLIKMKQAGLRRIMYGFETGVEERLSTLQKRFSIDGARETAKLTKKIGIEIIGFFMIGIPKETKESIKQTIKFAKEVDIDFAKFNILVPYPGTKLYEQLIQERKLRVKDNQDWQRFTSYPTKKIKPIYVPETISADELIRLQKTAVKQFYLRPKIILRHLFKIRTLNLKDLILGLISIFS